ncbi:MAG: hypothetical protein IJP81_01310 [Bacteroidales bacterium]|nr:hypothetical protein [Bacteroidales bacterium]
MNIKILNYNLWTAVLCASLLLACKKQPAKAGSVNGYTIRWKNLNGSEDSDFTYEVKL